VGTQVNIGDSRVIESREVGDGMAIRRRREAPNGQRFTTYERIEKPNLIVIKKDGSRELYDRQKLTTAIRRSVGKFFAGDAEIEKIIDSVEDNLYAKNEMEIPSKLIGDLILDELAKRNDVAYVRFASVYHEFKTLDEFESILAARRKEKTKR
jgi:transcriptional repressor NrdR|tara:strand:- start:3337 stop:3795 length:459 start_codon:yes stop_codon:yes gene_type:complete